MEELVCTDCFQTYNPPGHYCVNKIWNMVNPNRNIPFKKVEEFLETLAQGCTPATRDKPISVSTGNQNMNYDFYSDFSFLNHDIISSEQTLSCQDSMTAGASNQSDIIPSEQFKSRKQAITDLSSISLLNENGPGATNVNMSMRQSFLNNQISTSLSPLAGTGSKLGVCDVTMSLPTIHHTSDTTDTKCPTGAEMIRIPNPKASEPLYDIGAFAAPSHLVYDVRNNRSLFDKNRFSPEVCLKSPFFANPGEKTVACNVYPSRFKHERNLKSHTRLHEQIVPCECKFCKRPFVAESALEKHENNRTIETPFTCDVCGKGFKQNQDLKRHMRTHTGERPYTCEICGDSFKQKIHLQTHFATHTGEKPFSCEICGSSFTRKGNLQEHIRFNRCKKLLEF